MNENHLYICFCSYLRLHQMMLTAMTMTNVSAMRLANHHYRQGCVLQNAKPRRLSISMSQVRLFVKCAVEVHFYCFYFQWKIGRPWPLMRLLYNGCMRCMWFLKLGSQTHLGSCVHQMQSWQFFLDSLVNRKKLCELTYVCTCACTYMHACTHTHSVSPFVSLSLLLYRPPNDVSVCVCMCVHACVCSDLSMK